jgi:hypothetical protein
MASAEATRAATARIENFMFVFGVVLLKELNVELF